MKKKPTCRRIVSSFFCSSLSRFCSAWNNLFSKMCNFSMAFWCSRASAVAFVANLFYEIEMLSVECWMCVRMKCNQYNEVIWYLLLNVNLHAPWGDPTFSSYFHLAYQQQFSTYYPMPCVQKIFAAPWIHDSSQFLGIGSEAKHQPIRLNSQFTLFYWIFC